MRLPPPLHKRGWAGGGVQPGLAVRAQNIGVLAQVLAGALCARPPRALPRPGILPLGISDKGSIRIRDIWDAFAIIYKCCSGTNDATCSLFHALRGCNQAKLCGHLMPVSVATSE
jgi:hypothetical protein